MPKTTAEVRTYRWLAKYYDEFFGSARAPLVRAREKILARVLPRVTVACDLACGTGTTALDLAERGIRMYAVDLSPVMCALTREKMRQKRAAGKVIRGDMRSFRLPERVELITCEYDALNHIPNRADLGKVANAVARALKPGGHFFFDVNNAKGFAQYWTGTVCFEKPEIVMLMRSGHSRTEQTAWCDVDWFLREGRRWQRVRERVDEVCWSAEEIERTFRKAGFGEIRSWDAARFFGDGSPVTRGCRSVYLMQRA